MNNEDKTFWRRQEGTILKWGLGLFSSGVIGITAFYFTTTTALAQQSKDIESVKQDVKSINQIPTSNSFHIKQINVKMKKQEDETEDLKKKIETMRKEQREDNIRLSNKLDRILEKL